MDLFYRKVLADDRIKSFFDGINMDRQIAKQKEFLSITFDGPNSYKGADMRRGHQKVVAKGLNDSHFDAVIELLGASLQELGVENALIAEVAAIAESVRGEVLNR